MFVLEFLQSYGPRSVSTVLPVDCAVLAQMMATGVQSNEPRLQWQRPRVADAGLAGAALLVSCLCDRAAVWEDRSGSGTQYS